MAKQKPNSIPTSEEGQIRTRARNLPIHKCYVNTNWLESQMANILITRKHTNGNFTLGSYLVDLKLRGVKDCVYKFNESPVQIDNYIKSYPDMYQECDYNLVHNIIHAGVEFAGDYGFEPHRDFKTAQYILDEDTDDIPMMEIPLGDDGIPVLELRPGESGQREIAILRKTAGDDFHIIYIDEDGKPQRKERTYEEVMQYIQKNGFDTFLNKNKKKFDSFVEWQVYTDLICSFKIFSDEQMMQIENTITLISKDPRLNKEIDMTIRRYEKELDLAKKYFADDDLDKTHAEIRNVIDKHPDDPLLWDLLLSILSRESDCVDDETVAEANQLFPEHPVIKAWYAEWLA